jgi:hypothetical protein
LKVLRLRLRDSPEELVRAVENLFVVVVSHCSSSNRAGDNLLSLW